MNKQFFNEKGLTLVELLATIAIGGIVMILLFNILLPMQKQYGEQSEKVDQLTDVTIAAKTITKDLRSANSVEIIEDDHIVIETPTGEISYQRINNVIQKNGSNYIYDIDEFQVLKENSTYYVTIGGESKRIETNIVLRGDDD